MAVVTNKLRKATEKTNPKSCARHFFKALYLNEHFRLKKGYYKLCQLTAFFYSVKLCFNLSQ